MLSRREFFKRASIIAAAGVAANELELLDRLKTPVKYFFGRHIARHQALPIELTCRGVDGCRYTRWTKPGLSMYVDHPFTLERIDYHGPLPKTLEDLGLTSVNLPMTTLTQHAGKGSNLTIVLPEPIVYIGGDDLYMPGAGVWDA